MTLDSIVIEGLGKIETNNFFDWGRIQVLNLTNRMPNLSSLAKNLNDLDNPIIKAHHTHNKDYLFTLKGIDRDSKAKTKMNWVFEITNQILFNETITGFVAEYEIVLSDPSYLIPEWLDKENESGISIEYNYKVLKIKAHSDDNKSLEDIDPKRYLVKIIELSKQSVKEKRNDNLRYEKFKKECNNIAKEITRTKHHSNCIDALISSEVEIARLITPELFFLINGKTRKDYEISYGEDNATIRFTNLAKFPLMLTDDIKCNFAQEITLEYEVDSSMEIQKTTSKIGKATISWEIPSTEITVAGHDTLNKYVDLINGNPKKQRPNTIYPTQLPRFEWLLCELQKQNNLASLKSQEGKVILSYSKQRDCALSEWLETGPRKFMQEAYKILKK